MNETFQFRRFCTYLKYDLTQLWRNHGRALMVIAGMGLLTYVFTILFNLVFQSTWQAPELVTRCIVLAVAFLVLELYQARVYGHLTDRKAGSAWLMVPASRLEKYVSMLLTVIVIIPVLFFVVYLLLDGFLSLVDPTVGDSIVATLTGGLAEARTGMESFLEESPVVFSSGTGVGLVLLSIALNFTFFLLCGICFKKYKIVGGLLIIWFASLVLSLLGMAAIIPNSERIMAMADEGAVSMATGWLNGVVAFSCLLFAGLAWGVWRRIKTLQH